LLDICESEAYADDLSIDEDCLIELNCNLDLFVIVANVGAGENSKGIEDDRLEWSESVEGVLGRDIADSMGAEIFLSFVSETESGVCWVGGK